jgi:amino-acid N-acetyltransferase
MHVRAATAADLAAIDALLTEARLPANDVRDHLATFLVGERDDTVVAAAGLEVCGDVALVRSVVVHPSHRGRGLGERLCTALLARARALGVTHCYLLTETAPGFFTSLGFAEASRAAAPPAIQATREFAELCPASATFRARALD